MMRRLGSARWLVYGAAALALFGAGHCARAALIRRKRIGRGELKPLRSAWRQIGPLRVHARTATGATAHAALPVILVHGFGISSAYFVPAAERLGTRLEVYAPDLPGHGRSDTPAHAYGIGEQARVLIEWMDAMRIEQASLVANSMGCQIAVEMALRHPARVGRLVLIGPTLDPANRNLVRLFGRAVRAALHERARLGILLVRDYLRMGPRLPREFAFMLGDTIEHKLPRLHVPTLLVRGEYDALAPRVWLQHMARLIGDGAQVAEVPGTGHAAHYSAADALVERIAPFLCAGRLP